MPLRIMRRPSAPPPTTRNIYLFRRRRRHRQTAARHQYINSVDSVLGCCRFVTDEYPGQIRYSSRVASVRFQGGWLFSYARVRTRCRSCFPTPKRSRRISSATSGPTSWLGCRSGSARPTRHQRAVRARRGRPRHQPDVLFRADAGSPGLEPARTALYRSVIDRLFGGYPDLTYASALHRATAAERPA